VIIHQRLVTSETLVAERCSLKLERRNLRAESSTPKPPRQNVRDAEFFSQIFWAQPYWHSSQDEGPYRGDQHCVLGIWKENQIQRRAAARFTGGGVRLL